MPTNTTFFDLLSAVEQYYGSGSDQWLEIARYGQSSEQFLQIVDQLPDYRAVTNVKGEILGWERLTSETTSSLSTAINSNVGTEVIETWTPATVETAQGEVIASKGIATSSGVQFITKSVIPAIAAAGVGIQLGKTIDKVAYEVGGLIWDKEELWALDPDNWDTITSGNDDLNSRVFNMIFGLNQTNNTMQPYIDEMALAHTALYMQQVGLFNRNDYEVDYDVSTLGYTLDKSGYPNPLKVVDANNFTVLNWRRGVYHYTQHWEVLSSSSPVIVALRQNRDGQTCSGIMMSKDPFTVKGWCENYLHPGEPTGWEDTYNSAYHEYSGMPGYYSLYGAVAIAESFYGATHPSYENERWSWTPNGSYVTELENDYPTEHDLICICYGNSTESEIGGFPGTGTQPGAVVPSLANDMTVDDVLNALKAQYPDLWNNAVEYPVMQPDGTTKTYTYVPTTLPETVSATDEQPTGDGEYINQQHPEYDPETVPDSMWKTIYDVISTPPSNTTTETGDGTTPPVVVPTGSASALYSVYNPSQSELNSFGAWLWSTNFVDQLLKLFNDPMQAIIGLHKVFAPPSIAGRGNIKVGYLDSGVTTNLVDEQYVTVDCGSVSLSEYFGNVFDYDPHTQVYIYLPFIGIEKLDTGDVMRSSINVVYHIDVITGACLAEINVTRDLSGGTLYTFTGNCAVQYPVSSGSYMGIVASIASIAGGVVGTISSGGALAPMAMGAVSGVLNAHTRVNHSGGFSGNAGAMGIKKPYLIITRPQTCLADEFPKFEGYPANSSVLVSDCTGYIECKAVHIENVPATDAELTEIENLLKSGVII